MLALNREANVFVHKKATWMSRCMMLKLMLILIYGNCPAGEPGLQGPPGADGEKGQAGVDGIPGSTGERGDPGLCFSPEVQHINQKLMIIVHY